MVLRSQFCAIALVLTVLSPAKAEISWQQAIDAVQAKSDRFFEIARGIDSDYLGSAYNEIDANKHRCSILGRMVGKRKETQQLDVPAIAEPKTGHDYRLEGQSLANWVVAAQYLLTLSKQQKIRLWNTDCVGRMGVPVSAHIPESFENEFYDIRNDVLHVWGPVTNGYAGRLKASLDANPAINTVALGSNGGDVIEALEAGYEIRRRGLGNDLVEWLLFSLPPGFPRGRETNHLVTIRRSGLS